MLAKLSGWPMITQVSSVRKPDSTTGASVSPTWRRLRSTANSSRLISTNASTPALMNACATVCAACCVSTGAPVACGATVRTFLVKRSSTALSLLFPLGKTRTNARPSRAIQSLAISGGKSARVTAVA